MNEADVLMAMRGDEAACRRLIEASASTVCSIALAIVRNVEASEDVAQEVFLAVWSSLGKLRNPRSFLPWLRQLTRNQAHLWLRGRARERSDEDVLGAAIDRRPTPLDSVLAEEERRVLDDVLDALAEDAREVVVLYYREGSSAKQVAELLGISEDAVKQRLSRARAKVREEMLRRFGGVLVRTAPGAAFVTVVAAAMTTAAPPAAAAIVAAKSGGGKLALGFLSMTTLAAALAGAVGAVMGMKHLEPYFDEREAEDLRRFRNQSIAVTTFFALLLSVAVTQTPRLPWRLASLLAFYGALAWLYAGRLPRILERRYEWERSLDPQVDGWQRRRWMYATIAQAAAAATGGAVILMLIVDGFFAR